MLLSAASFPNELFFIFIFFSASFVDWQAGYRESKQDRCCEDQEQESHGNENQWSTHPSRLISFFYLPLLWERKKDLILMGLWVVCRLVRWLDWWMMIWVHLGWFPCWIRASSFPVTSMEVLIRANAICTAWIVWKMLSALIAWHITKTTTLSRYFSIILQSLCFWVFLVILQWQILPWPCFFLLNLWWWF